MQLLRIPMPRYGSTIGVIVAVAVLVGVVFASFASYARKETAVGWLVPEKGLVRVVPRAGGIVSSLAVEEGAFVERGDIIATIRSAQSLSSGDVATAITSQLTLEAEALRDAAGASHLQLASRRAELAAERRRLADASDSTASRLTLAERKLALVDGEMERRKPLLDKGFVSLRDIESIEARRTAILDEMIQLREQNNRNASEMRRIDAQLSGLAAEDLRARADSSAALAGIEQRRIQNDLAGGYVLRAPVSGRVAGLTANSGDTVSGSALCAILPKGSALFADLFVSSRAVGFIRPGNAVRLQYHAFPHQRFGAPVGTVMSISQAAIPPEELKIPTMNAAEPMFRVRVRLPDQSIKAYGKRIPLQPSSLLTAEVVTDRRTLVEWLLDPLFANASVS
ncbi:HlyD family efflux transporter periplasmic adaptor subunit [Porphyrobacter sp. YT40]|uniref:HlyD family efflux transporter periplasmic adaptor subunit n=1 Tax=Porphyrobacter sp. YT40 TaxID=2547601 RepID=UPI00257310E1|nr:HlyD family efflux transporter periplasmic adaptor subunit [Porphyrobacter sp. YT40]